MFGTRNRLLRSSLGRVVLAAVFLSGQAAMAAHIHADAAGVRPIKSGAWVGDAAMPDSDGCTLCGLVGQSRASHFSTTAAGAVFRPFEGVPQCRQIVADLIPRVPSSARSPPAS